MQPLPPNVAHFVYIPFLFALGACIGSFLNVVVWRLPRGQSLVRPPSHCPSCNHLLAWSDNIPVIGWIKLRGRCRYCAQAISPRYPIVEAVTGGIFVLYYVLYFITSWAPCVADAVHADALGNTVRPFVPLLIQNDWPIFALHLFLLSSLLAASLIDIELFIIPLRICWLMAIVGIVGHAIIDRPALPGAVLAGPISGAVGAGGGLGLAISMLLWWRGIMPTSFPDGEPLLDIDREHYAIEVEAAKARGETVEPLPPAYTRAQIRIEIGKEMLFLLPPLIGAAAWLALTLPGMPAHAPWLRAMQSDGAAGFLGAVVGGCVGGFVVWIARILGTLGFGRVAMGLGDVHLMFGVGAIVGPGPAAVAFFLAPFAGLLAGLYRLLVRSSRELPYGPYLSLATAFVLCCYCPIADYLRPGLTSLGQLLAQWAHGG